MYEVSTVGLDIAKQIFHAHGVDSAGSVLFHKKLRRHEVLEFFSQLPRCLVGIEACATSHHWA